MCDRKCRGSQVRKTWGHLGNRETNKILMGFNLKEKERKPQLTDAAESCSYLWQRDLRTLQTPTTQPASQLPASSTGSTWAKSGANPQTPSQTYPCLLCLQSTAICLGQSSSERQRPRGSWRESSLPEPRRARSGDLGLSVATDTCEPCVLI